MSLLMSTVDVSAIKAKTDLLPADPASNTEVDTRATQVSVNAGFLAGAKEATINAGFLAGAKEATSAAINTLVSILGLANFKQETAPATGVNGINWKDLLDKSALTKPTKICGFKVTKNAGWAGVPKIRIVNGSGATKLFPFQTEYQEGTDFTSGNQYTLSFPVVIPQATGYKLQFQSTNAGDGAGQTLQLNNLDVIEVG